jgi:uncharacterized protein YjiS (DUF1127 family)
MSDFRASDFRTNDLRTRDLAAAVLRLILWPARLIAARAALAQLAALDARELADIGLSRSDLRDATALRSGADPTDFLAERVEAKRAAAPRPQAPPRPTRRRFVPMAKTGS